MSTCLCLMPQLYHDNCGVPGSTGNVAEPVRTAQTENCIFEVKAKGDKTDMKLRVVVQPGIWTTL